MELLLAFDVSTDEILKAIWSTWCLYWPWIVAGTATTVTAIIAVIRRLWNQFINFVHPMVVKAYDEGIQGVQKHNALVDTFREYVPFVSKELEKLADGQEVQNGVIEQVAKKQDEHGVLIEDLHRKLTVGNG